MNVHLENPIEYLTKNNIKPYFQRIKILECLSKSNSHPTVDDIYKEVVKEIPTLSKTTVYNTLALFLKSNIIRDVFIEKNEIRYDFMLTTHGHFKCKQCEKIYDFPIDIDDSQSEILENFQIHEKDVYFKGICSKCI